MPPRSLGSAATLVSLSVFAAVEAGGCDKHPESLRSITRSALPMLAQAARSTGTESSYALSDYGLAPRPELRHVCGHYEVGRDGRLRTWDLFVGHTDPRQLQSDVDRELAKRTSATPDRPPKTQVSVRIHAANHFAWPENCPRLLDTEARSVLLGSRIL